MILEILATVGVYHLVKNIRIDFGSDKKDYYQGLLLMQEKWVKRNIGPSLLEDPYMYWVREFNKSIRG